MENRNTSRRDSCFHLIDSARPDFDQLVEFMLQTWTHRKWGRVCREAQPIQSLKFRLQQEFRHDNSVDIAILSERSDTSCQEAMKAPVDKPARLSFSCSLDLLLNERRE